MKRPSAATVIATLALFVALGGTGYAAVALAPNSVGSAQIKDGAVQSPDIKDGAVGNADIADGAIDGAAIKSGSIEVTDLSKGALKGLDGKDGTNGKDGAQGPAGPAGPAGTAGKDATGALKLVDAYGATVTGVQPSLSPATVVNGTGDIYTTSQSGIVRLVNGALWVLKSDGTYDRAGVGYSGNVYFRSSSCIGPMYLAVGGPSLLYVTPVGVTSGSPPYTSYRTSGTIATPAGGSWYSYYSFANSDASCGAASAPGSPNVTAYDVTTDVPTTPTASTPPFTWVATN